MAMQKALHMTQFGLRENPELFPFARFHILKSVGLSLRRAQQFEAEYRGRLWGVTTKSEILAVLNDFSVASNTAKRDPRPSGILDDP